MKSKSEMSADMAEQKPQSSPRAMWKGIVEGTVLGAGAMPVLTPLFYWTARGVAQMPFVWKESMGSVRAYVSAVAPITAVSYTCNQVMTDMVKRWQGSVTDAQSVMIAGAAGAVAGVANTPFDVVAQAKQVGEQKVPMVETARQVVRSNGVLAMMRGAGMGVPREALWAGAWMKGVPMVTQKLQAVGCEENIAKLAAPMFVGSAFGLVSTPMNVLRYAKQEALTQPKMNESYVSIMKRYGMKGLFASVLPRTATMVVGAGIFAKGAELMQEYSPLSNKK